MLQPGNLAIETVGQDQRAEIGDGDLVVGVLLAHVGDAEEDFRRVALGLEIALHRGDLGGLVGERVEPMQVADDDLSGRGQRRHPHRHREHHARAPVVGVAQEMIRADAADEKGDAEIRGEHHMGQPNEERRIEDDRQPVLRHEASVGADRIAGRGLHPGIGRKDPCGGDQGAERDHQRRQIMEPASDSPHAEQHDAEEARFKKERRQHLVAHQRADDRPRLVGERRPVRAELVRHHQPGDDAHREADRKYLQPVLEEIEKDLPARREPQPFEHGEIARKPDRQRGKDDMEYDGEGELRARKVKGVQREHDRSPRGAEL